MNSQLNLSHDRLVQAIASDRRTARITRWWKVLKGKPSEEYDIAMRKLGKMEDPRLIEVYIDMLTHPSSEIRRWALSGISKMKRMNLSKKVFSKMVKLTRAKDLETKELGLDALVALKMPELTTPHVGKMLFDMKISDFEHERLVLKTVVVLAGSRDPRAEKILRKMLAESRFALFRRKIQEGLRAFN